MRCMVECTLIKNYVYNDYAFVGLIPEDSPILEIPAKVFPESSGWLFIWIFVSTCGPLIIGVLFPGFITVCVMNIATCNVLQ